MTMKNRERKNKKNYELEKYQTKKNQVFNEIEKCNILILGLHYLVISFNGNKCHKYLTKNVVPCRVVCKYKYILFLMT